VLYRSCRVGRRKVLCISPSRQDAVRAAGSRPARAPAAARGARPCPVARGRVRRPGGVRPCPAGGWRAAASGGPVARGRVRRAGGARPRPAARWRAAVSGGRAVLDTGAELPDSVSESTFDSVKSSSRHRCALKNHSLWDLDYKLQSPTKTTKRPLPHASAGPAETEGRAKWRYAWQIQSPRWTDAKPGAICFACQFITGFRNGGPHHSPDREPLAT
jgi:hypothetical protein